jgi:lipid-A-disaccharide synthase
VRIAESESPFPLVRGESFTVLRAAEAALCKSGTTTLEAAVAGCPLVVVYRTNGVTFAMARRLVQIQHIGLVNVVRGREVAPEFVQRAFTPGAVAAALIPLLRAGSPERDRMLRDLEDVRVALGQPGAAARVAQMASDLLTAHA